ncbi:MAG TPA: IS200/IS605 family transposase [Ignavibacteria bacterium]|nr:IS200/IS605 family transposase [Ignavibacteria bacterium]
MSRYIHKRHNVSVILYHLVCPAKYRKLVFSDDVEVKLRDICLEIAKRHEIEFIEIGVEEDHVHFLIQSVPSYDPTKIARIVKSITAREIFKGCPEVKKKLWGGEFWTKGYFVNTVGQHGNEHVIQQYVQNQGKEYKKLHRQEIQLELF